MIMTPTADGMNLEPFDLTMLNAWHCERIIWELDFVRDVLAAIADFYEDDFWGCIDSGLL
jgi:hypothetical protein